MVVTATGWRGEPNLIRLCIGVLWDLKEMCQMHASFLFRSYFQLVRGICSYCTCWRLKRETPLMSWSNETMVVYLSKESLRYRIQWIHHLRSQHDAKIHQISFQPMLRLSNWWRTPSVTWATTWFWLRCCQSSLCFPPREKTGAANFGVQQLVNL